MRYWLVVNEISAAGKSESERWRRSLARAGVKPVLARNFHDSRWVDEIEPGDCILAAGGDGSVNHAAGICIERNAILGVLPSGTANDFARNLGLPRDPEALCQLIARNKWHWLDVARYDTGLFLNVAHVGLGTAAVRENGPKQKARWGRFVYALTILQRLREHRGFHATVTADMGEVDGRWLSLAIATGAYYGGGHSIPAASADDGQLDIIAVRPRSFLRLFATFIFMRLRGRSPDQTSTFVHLKARKCQITTRKPQTVTADGEVVGNTPLKVRCAPGSLPVICEKIIHT